MAIPLAGIDGHDALIATAAGTSLGTGVALLLVGLAVWRAFGAFIPPLTALRGLLAGGVGFAVARFVPHETGLTALGALAAGFFAYLAALVVVRELGRAELDQLKAIVQKRRGGV